ncbi:hypothetical protein GCM10023322_65310 [Rugosimonospora acidiphila]|uniref:Uncharacterized protein n=1 Tax=Rugosimonospora acidiphila TaxID=556531 RepID=A0ABP9SJN2_9ACTN
MIDSLTAFTVVPEYGRSRTVYQVLVGDQSAPVAQLRKDSAYDSLRPLAAFTGPGLDQHVGWVSAFRARGVDRVEVGRVEHRGGSTWSGERWSFAQAGLPELRGEQVGLGGKLRGRLPLQGFVDGVLSVHLRFGAPGLNGFDLTRFSGVRARYGVEIHDPRISRLLVLACVVHYNVFQDADPRQVAIDYTSNPFRD